MVHHSQGLALRLESGNHRLGIHAQFDDLERDFAANRLLLLSHVNNCHTPFADLLQELITPDDRAGGFHNRRTVKGDLLTPGWSFEKIILSIIDSKEILNMTEQIGIVPACGPQISRSLRNRLSNGGVKNVLFVVFFVYHLSRSKNPVPLYSATKRSQIPSKKSKKPEKFHLRWFVLSIDFCTQPATRVDPMSLGGGMGDIQDLGGLGDGQSGKIPEFHQIGFDLILLSEPVQSLI